MVKLTDYMETRNTDSFPKPPGTIQVLGQGFNAIANNITVIALPILLDLLLWLGPRIRLTNLMQPYFDEWLRLEASGQSLPMETSLLTEFWQGFNLLAILRTFPLGVPSLMSASLVGGTPLGAPLELENDSWLMALGWLVMLSLVGWTLGALYYRQIAQAATNAQVDLPRALFHSLLLSGGWNLFALMAGIPALLILGILMLINGLLANIAYLIILVLVLWLCIPVFFSAHGIFIKNHNAFQAVAQSFRLVRYGLPPLGWFALLAILLSQGMDMLWRIPPTNSWMALVGILGHAFIASSLLAASFIYYYEMNNWIERAAQWLNSQSTSASA